LDTKFTEIEHKFLIDSGFDRDSFLATLAQLGPVEETKVKVQDTYFVPQPAKHYILRHRFDELSQQLSLKSIGSGDNEARVEINLDLDQSKGNQIHSVQALITALGAYWQGEIQKNIHVFYFPDCEVVLYDAATKSKSVSCVEFEAVNADSIEHGIKIIKKYERSCGFSSNQRCQRSLFELLLEEEYETAKP